MPLNKETKPNLYLKLFNSVQTNDWYQIELSMFDRNTWNHLTMQTNDRYKIVSLVLDSNALNYLTNYKQMSSSSFKDVNYSLTNRINRIWH